MSHNHGRVTYSLDVKVDDVKMRNVLVNGHYRLRVCDPKHVGAVRAGRFLEHKAVDEVHPKLEPHGTSPPHPT
jgi:hypothetical protein